MGSLKLNEVELIMSAAIKKYICDLAEQNNTCFMPECLRVMADFIDVYTEVKDDYLKKGVK